MSHTSTSKVLQSTNAIYEKGTQNHAQIVIMYTKIKIAKKVAFGHKCLIY